MLMQTTELLTE